MKIVVFIIKSSSVHHSTYMGGSLLCYLFEGKPGLSRIRMGLYDFMGVVIITDDATEFPSKVMLWLNIGSDFCNQEHLRPK